MTDSCKTWLDLNLIWEAKSSLCLHCSSNTGQGYGYECDDVCITQVTLSFCPIGQLPLFWADITVFWSSWCTEVVIAHCKEKANLLSSVVTLGQYILDKYAATLFILASIKCSEVFLKFLHDSPLRPVTYVTYILHMVLKLRENEVIEIV